jgi:hypothetical protein
LYKEAVIKTDKQMSTERLYIADNDNEAFLGVVLRGVDEETFGIRLLHPNGAFSLDLAEADEFDVVADWRSAGRKFNLPLLIEQENGDITHINQRFGALNISSVKARKRGMWSLYNRRPRSISRRRQAAKQQSKRQNNPSIAV